MTTIREYVKTRSTEYLESVARDYEIFEAVAYIGTCNLRSLVEHCTQIILKMSTSSFAMMCNFVMIEVYRELWERSHHPTST
jgi:hypothetical protein